MTRFPYEGADVRVYPAYLDAATGRTLTAEPGGEYDIVPVDEAAVPPRDGRWPDEEPEPDATEQDQAEPPAEAAPPAAEPDKPKPARKSPKGSDS